MLIRALAAAIGLIPLALGAGQTGKEVLHSLAIVVIGGLISSTLLDPIVTPALSCDSGGHRPGIGTTISPPASS